MRTAVALLIGYILDLIFGDPHSIPHPVQGYGWCITKIEKQLRRLIDGGFEGHRGQDPEGKAKRELAAGAALVVLVILAAVLPAALLLWACGLISPWLTLAAEGIICYQMMAAKSLKTESMKVYKALRTGNLEASRKAVSMIVGRDTKNLTVEGVTRAAVETVAENTSDGVIAPLFYMAIGGPLWGVAYKAINTMDSMVGYKNEKYLYLGRAAAKLDDVVNYIPARLSAFLMLAAAAVLGLFHRAPTEAGMDVKNGFRIFKRDRKKHASPNSAQTEAVMAGVLRIQLAGDAWYFGKLHKKEFIGDDLRNVVIEDIPRANSLLYATTLVAMVVFVAVRLLVCG